MCVCMYVFNCVCVSVYESVFSRVCLRARACRFVFVCAYYAQVEQSLASTPCTRSLTAFGRVPTRGCVIFFSLYFFRYSCFLFDELWETAKNGVHSMCVINR